MAINSDHVLAFPFEQYFVDKDTGLPLSAGVLEFFKDTARTTPKSVFILGGSPPNYTYVDIGNEVTLDAVGVPNYNGTNVALYFYPYDDDGNVELYYIKCSSDGGVLQFTREGIPNISVTGEPEQEFKNYIPNGQFISHIDLPADLPTYLAGQIRENITNIAYGGWTFERPNGSTATDIVTFHRQPSIVDTYSGYPRFILDVQNTVISSGDTYKDVRIKFLDVNKFASTVQSYTFAFTAESQDESSIPVSLYLIKNFGSGGSPETSTLLTSFTVTAAIDIYYYNFTFGTNEAKTLGTDDQDFVQLALRLPVGSQFHIQLSDFILGFGNISVTSFPPTPTSEFQYQSIAGFLPIPNPDGSDLYLPIKLTSAGLTYDDSCVGDVVSESQSDIYVDSLHPTSNRMLGDGAQYKTDSYSPLGIPYSRLQSKYWNSTTSIPIYGTGDGYFCAIIYSNFTNQLIINNNTQGLVVNATDVSTGFTVTTIHEGQPISQYAYIYGTALDSILMIDTGYNSIDSPTAGTSGFAVELIQQGTSVLHAYTTVTCAVPGGGISVLAGKYFTFGNSGDNYYVWYTVDGVGVNPLVPSKTAIKVDLVNQDDIYTLTEKTRQSVNGWQVTTVDTVAASGITAQDYFTINSTEDSYYVWYKVSGSGTDPEIAGKIGIEVDISASDTAAQVATKTQIAINMKYFKVPDIRGLFMRGYSGTNTENDPEQDIRLSLVPGIQGNKIGTYQVDEIGQHVHSFATFAENAVNPGGGTDAGTAGSEFNTNTSGGYESRPRNLSVNFAILY